MELNVLLDVKLKIDPETFECTVVSCTPIEKPKKSVLEMLHTVSVTEENYGILTIGALSEIGKLFQKGMEITVVFYGNNQRTSLFMKTHNSIRGRIDSFTKFYNRNSVRAGTVLKLIYNIEANTLEVSVANDK